MEKIKVLQIGMHDQMGGVENFIMNYYRNIDKSKFQFDFLIPYKDGGYYDNEIKKMGGNIFCFSFKNDKNIFKFLKELNKFFKNNHYDIVHCNDTGLGALYLLFAKKYKYKIRIAHSHATSFESGIKGLLKEISGKFYVKLANCYYACSTEAGRFLFKNKKFEIISNSIEYDKYLYNEIFRRNIRLELDISEDEILLGNIGRFSEQKNQKVLINILSLLSNKYKLILIGEGPLEDELKKIVKEMNLEGRVCISHPKHDVYKYYNAMDIFVLPSLYEGLPIVGIESQVNGLPCLFSNNISKEVVLNSNVKFLDLNNIKEWVEYIKSANLIREDNIRDIFNIKKNANILEKKYLELIKV